MARNRPRSRTPGARFAALLVVSLSSPLPLIAQEEGTSGGLAVAYGLILGRTSGIFSDDIGLTPRPGASVIRAGITTGGALVLSGHSTTRSKTSRLGASVDVTVSTGERKRYYGRANESPLDRPGAYYDITQRRYRVAPALLYGTPAVRFTLSPFIEHVHTDASIDVGIPHVIGDPRPTQSAVPAARVATIGLMQLTRPYGSGRFTQAGLAARMAGRFTGADGSERARVRAGASFYPAIMSTLRPYARFDAAVSVNHTWPLPGKPTVVLRAGGAQVLGEAPFFELATVGGRSSLRAYPRDRFAGSGSAFGQAELHLTLGTLPVRDGVAVGVLALADAGRVWDRALTDGGWHGSRGGGIWIAPTGLPPISVSLAQGAEGTRASISFGGR